MIRLKRTQDSPAKSDGQRVLIDRLWPRGVKKSGLKHDRWLKDAAPSTELRKWFHHDPAKWEAFQRRYKAELDGNPTAWRPILDAAKHGDVTLLYGARDTDHNNAVVLKAYLEEHGAV